MKEQKEKLVHFKNALKKEIKKEELQANNINKLKKRVREIEEKNLKRRRDLNDFVWDFKDGKADAILGLIQQEWERKGRLKSASYKGKADPKSPLDWTKCINS